MVPKTASIEVPNIPLHPLRQTLEPLKTNVGPGVVKWGATKRFSTKTYRGPPHCAKFAAPG